MAKSKGEPTGIAQASTQTETSGSSHILIAGFPLGAAGFRELARRDERGRAGAKCDRVARAGEREAGEAERREQHEHADRGRTAAAAAAPA